VIRSFLAKKKEAFLQWVTDRRIKKKLKTEWLPDVNARLKNNPKTVFLILTPEHGNLGDHAIAYAEAQMLRELGIDYIEVTEKRLWQLKKNNMLSVMNGHTILINGGGNLGTLWIGVEYIQRAVIRENPDSSIMILPNTIFYEDSEWGQKEYEDSLKVYNAHNSLYLYAREQSSYEFMKNAYHHVKLVPDMVLSLDMRADDVQRNGCVLCLRDDCEKTRTDEDEVVLMEQVKQLFGENFRHSDMRLNHPVSVEDRKSELEAKWDDFRRAELVITDRLHGMIFCAITGTPCIVINSKSPKVKGCYEWIKDVGFVMFADDPLQIAECYQMLRFNKTPDLYPLFDELKNDIQTVVTKRG